VMAEASFDCNIVLHYTSNLNFYLFFEFLGNGFHNRVAEVIGTKMANSY